MKYPGILLVLMAALFLSTTVSRAQDLKTTLEKVQEDVRQAIVQADLDAFRRAQCGLSETGEMTRGKFRELAADEAFQDIMLGWFFQDLRRETRFLAVKTDGQWAAYYAETLLDDPEYAAVTAFLFRRAETGWQACGAVIDFSMALPGSRAAQRGLAAWEGREEMLQAIETDPDLSLEHLIVTATEKVDDVD